MSVFTSNKGNEKQTVIQKMYIVS